MTRRVVITGIGAITPIGTGADQLWRGLQRGTVGIGPVSRFDTAQFRSKLAAEVSDFDPLDYLDSRKARRLDRFSQFAVAASRLALEDGHLPPDPSDGRAIGVYVGSALGGIVFGEEQHSRFLDRGIQGVEPTLALTVFGGAGATNVAIEFGFKGPAVGNANSCASGAVAIGEAFRLIRAGGAEVVLAGGAETPLAPLTFGAFALIKAMSRRCDEPERASRPFDRNRDGFVMGEGAAMLVLEDLEHAITRGARPYAEVLGYGATNDAYHMITPRPTGAEAARAMILALDDAALRPEDIGYLNAHATSTPLGDTAEALAINHAFGEHVRRLPVSGTKGLYGHPLGASGAVEAAITTLVLDRQWMPPTFNLDEPDPDCAIVHVPLGGCDSPIDAAVTNSFGFGGINTSLVLARWRDR